MGGEEPQLLPAAFFNERTTMLKSELQDKYDALVEQGHIDSAKIASMNNKIVDMQKNLNDADKEVASLEGRMDAVRLALKAYTDAHVEHFDEQHECNGCGARSMHTERVEDPVVKYMRLLADKLSTEEPLFAGQVAYYAR